MELELKKNAYGFYDILFDLESSREETLDAIVPDACSDILRLVDTYGTVFVRGREVRDERLEVTGSVRAEVLYVPEEGRGLHRLEVNIPFSQMFEAEGIKPSAEVIAGAGIRSIDTQMINPRKVLVRVSLSVFARVYEPRMLELCSGVAEAEKNGVQILPGEYDAVMPAAVRTKSFSVTDEIEIQAGRPALAEIMRSDIRLIAGDTRLIGHKMVFKGTAFIKVLYRAAGEHPSDDLFTFESEFPFSQIIEMDDIGDEAECLVFLSLSEFHISERLSESGGARVLSIAFDAEAQAVAYASRKLQTVSDLYSTKRKTAIEVKPQGFTGLAGRLSRSQTIRESFETGVSVKSVIDSDVSFSQVSMRQEKSEIIVESSALVRVVYFGEDGLVYSASRSLPVNLSLEAAEKHSGRAVLSASAIAAGAAPMGGVEIRFNADFEVELTQREQVSSVFTVTFEEDDGESSRPSVVLRCPGEEDTLWSVAKRYRTTMRDISEANGLEDEGAPLGGKLLLIPGRR